MTAMIKRVRSTQRFLCVKIRLTSRMVRTRRFYTEVVPKNSIVIIPSIFILTNDTNESLIGKRIVAIAQTTNSKIYFSATITHILHPKLLHLLYDRLLIFVKKGKGYKPYTEGKFPDLFSNKN